MTVPGFSIGVPSIRGDHHTGPDGMITFVGNSSIYRTDGFEEPGNVYYLDGLITPPGAVGGIIRVVDETYLREKNALRGISQNGTKIVVVTIEF